MSREYNYTKNILMDPKRRCTECRKESNLCCGVCKFAYCSKECQKRHWLVHKIMCAKWKWRRLTKFLSHFRSTSDSRKFSFVNLSSDSVIVQTKEYGYSLEIAALPGAVGGLLSVCGICQEAVYKNGTYNPEKFEYLGIQVHYFRCLLCYTKKLKLDPYTLMDLQELRYYMLLCIQRLVELNIIQNIPKEIRILICSYIKI